MNGAAMFTIRGSLCSLLLLMVGSTGNAQWQSFGGGDCFAINADSINVFRVGRTIGCSGDLGRSWMDYNGGGNGNAGGQSLALRDSFVYAGTLSGVTRFVNHRIPWMNFESRLWYPDTFTLADKVPARGLAAGDNWLVAASAWQGVHRSTDNGFTWSASAGAPDVCNVFIATPRGQLLFGAMSGLYRSTDNGISFEAIGGSVIAGLSVNCVWEVESGAIYLASSTGRVFQSTNGGSSFEERGEGLPAGNTPASLTGTDDFLFLGTNRGIFLSTDDGEQWRTVSNGFIRTDTIVVSLLLHREFLFAGTIGDKPYDGIWRRPISEMIEPAGAHDAVQTQPFWTAIDDAGQLTIRMPEVPIVGSTVTLIDLLGRSRRIQLIEAGQREVYVDVGECEPGVYMIAVVSGSSRWFGKVIVCH